VDFDGDGLGDPEEQPSGEGRSWVFVQHDYRAL
jgi:hypothetical protein